MPRGCPHGSTRDILAATKGSMSLMSVVLPDPVGPTMLTTSPICKSMRDTGSTSLDLRRPPRMVMGRIMLSLFSEGTSHINDPKKGTHDTSASVVFSNFSAMELRILLNTRTRFFSFSIGVES